VLTPGEPKLLLRADLSPRSKRPEPPRPPPSTQPTPKGTPGQAGKKPPRVPSGKQGPAGKSQGQVSVVPIEGDQCLLAVDARPWAEVWVDGQKLGDTPLQRALPPGMRKIELRNPELKFSKTYRKQAKKGTKIKISETIQPPAGP